MSSESLSTQQIARQRLLGAYYTPTPLSRLLTNWAIRHSADRLLDPSFGACSFLVAGREALVARGSLTPDRDLFGIDIDNRAMAFASSVFGLEHLATNVRIADFLSMTPTSFGPELFATLVGNPPYVRHHWLDDAITEPMRTKFMRDGLRLPGTANAWAYFIAHAMSFLRTNGRLAFVLPGSALDVLYAHDLFAALCFRFREVKLVRVLERLFPDTTEQSVILLADGFGAGSAHPIYEQVADLSALSNLFAANSPSASDRAIDTASAWKNIVAREGVDVWGALEATDKTTTLGDVSRIGIGTVTGANHFFVRSAQDAAALGCRSQPIIDHSRHITTSLWDRRAQSHLESSGMRSRLLIIPSEHHLLSPALREAIDEAEEAGINSRFKCSLRDPWWCLEDLRAPDAFLPYMFASPRGLTGNHTTATSTNAVHRLSWTSSNELSHILSTWTSLFAFGLEYMGRSYGGGVLKIEPSRAKLLIVAQGAAVSPIEYASHERLLRLGRNDDARDFADNTILTRHLGLTSTEVTALKRGALALHAARARPS